MNFIKSNKNENKYKSCLPAGTAAGKQGIKKDKMHIITSLIEHDAILEPCMELEKNGFEITHLQVNKNGGVDIEKFKKNIKDNTN